MGDPLSIAASIVALLQLSSDVVDYVTSAAGSASERQRLGCEIRGCEFFLRRLKDGINDVDEGKMWAETIKALDGEGGPLQQLKAALTVIKAKLEPKRGFKKVVGALKWPFDVKEVEKILGVIERQKMLLGLVLSDDCRKLIQEVKKGSEESQRQMKEFKDLIEKMQNLQAASDRSHVEDDARSFISNLSASNYWAVHKQNLKLRQEGTNEWFLEHPQFKDWAEGSIKTLWCHGIPGAGKSIIASSVISHLQTRYRDPQIGICIIIFHYKTQSPTLDDIILSLIQQLLEYHIMTTKTLPACLKAVCKPDANSLTRGYLEMIPLILEELASLFNTIFIVVDGLDECEDDLQATVIEKLLALPFKDLRLFCTSRSLPRIRLIFEAEKSIEITAKQEDIAAYVKAQIQLRTRLRGQVQREPSLADEIVEGVITKASGMFLLAKFHIEALATKSNPTDVRKVLKELPATLTLTYHKVMDRIQSQSSDDKELSLKVLLWIAFALRPLKVKEMQHVITNMKGHSRLSVVQENDLTDLGTILDVCVGLVKVVQSADRNDGPYFAFVHSTTQEYLLRTMTESSPNVEGSLAATCINYLLSDSFVAGNCSNEDEFQERLRQNPFYSYAAMNWGYHARASSTELSRLILQFMLDNARFSASVQAMTRSRTFMGYDSRKPTKLTAMHIAAYFGLIDTILTLLKTGYSVDTYDVLGRSPLWWAAETGQHDAVVILVAQDGVKIDSKDSSGQTALLRATQNGHCTIISSLISNNADIGSKDKDGQTALSLAAHKGHERAVRFLLSKGADFNSKDEYGHTPLSLASENGHIEVVKLLLATSSDVDSKDEYGRTPLWWAAENGHQDIIKLLLAAGANVNSTDSEDRQTPLSWASRKGQKAVVELLLTVTGVDLNSRDRSGHTALLWAARKRHKAIMSLLLAAEGVNKNSKDYLGQTPLSWAAQEGYEELVALLLANDDIDIRCKDSWAETPLSWAEKHGHQEVVKMLIAAEKSRSV